MTACEVCSTVAKCKNQTMPHCRNAVHLLPAVHSDWSVPRLLLLLLDLTNQIDHPGGVVRDTDFRPAVEVELLHRAGFHSLVLTDGIYYISRCILFVKSRFLFSPYRSYNT